jgi:hypothetical protein
MRIFLLAAALIIAAAAFLVFTVPGQDVLRAFGVSAPDCIQARVLNTIGYHVPQCTCDNCSLPLPPPLPPTH